MIKKNSLNLQNFKNKHPYPDQHQGGIKSLYRFLKFDADWVKELFIDKKLHHSSPSNFIDPFECKPTFKWYQSNKKIIKIKEHLVKLWIKDGRKYKVAKNRIDKLDSSELVKNIVTIMHAAFAGLRICCFTIDRKNLLFWSHYADAHTGFCVEFDATKKPISHAFKVDYKNVFPEIIYPLFLDERDYIPALIKSEVWEYEEEFRIIFVPEAVVKLSGNDGYLFLNGDEIKNVYMGACMDEGNKIQLIEIVNEGTFSPGIWINKLSKSKFELEEELIVKPGHKVATKQ